MNKYYKFALSLAASTLFITSLTAQEADKGRVSASFETNSTIYTKDSRLNEVSGQDMLPNDRFGSNNYLKLDYIKGRFSVGVQFEAYEPVLQGYPTELGGADLTFKYVTWQDKNFSVTAGDFYDQFGSGLIFRSWEDRALGFNNSIEGARVTYSWNNTLNLKALWGRPRMYMERSSSQVRGVDLSFAISNLFDWEDQYLAIEGSYVNRYERVNNDWVFITNPNVDAFSARLNYEVKGFSLKGEMIGKGVDLHYTVNGGGIKKKGNAQLVELGYSGNGLGILATFRRLEYMENRINRDMYINGNMLNYIPSLTNQYTYLLTNLEPYGGTPASEIGGQFDLFYNFKKGTALGGSRGTKVHVNFSTFSTLDNDDVENTIRKGENLFTGASIDIEKWWNRKLKTTVLYAYHKKNINGGRDEAALTNHIIVGDVTYKFTNKTSMRAELQYLIADSDNEKKKDSETDWVAGLIELNFAPKWSVFFQDMYNHGAEKKDDSDPQSFDHRVNYWNVGFSYTYSKTRVAITYGRNRAGYICSGGVCRLMPAYTGANVSMNISF